MGLPCLVSQCAKLHVAGWKCAVFTHIYLEPCTWPVAIFMMDQRKEQRVCIKFCANLGKSAIETLTMIQQAFGDQSLSRARVFQWHAWFKTCRISVDDDKHTGRPTSCPTPETVTWIQELVHQDWRWTIHDIAEEVGIGYGHANKFWRKKWACTVSHPNLCPGSWQLTRSSSASTSTLNFVSLPLMMKPSCPGSSLVIRAAFTIMTLRQSNNPPSRKAPCHQGQIRPDRRKAMSRARSSLSLMSRGLCTKNLSQQAKLWTLGSTVTFCGDCVKRCEDFAPNFGENRPGCFTMTTHHLTLPSSPTSFWRKTKLLLSPTHRTPMIWHPVTSSYFLKWNWSWKDAGLIPLRRFRPKCRKCLTLWQKRTFRKRSKNGGDSGTSVNIRKGTTSRVTAADRPYGKFYDFYSVSLETFGSTHVNK